MFAQRRGDLDAGLGEFAVEELLEHRDAGPAAGAGAGAALEPGEVPDRFAALAGAAAVNGIADGPGGHVVAGAEDGVVGQLGREGVDPAASRGEVGAGFGRQCPAQQRPQRGVRGGIADEDPAEQGGGVVGGDDLLVDAAGRVRVDDLQRVAGAGEGVAEAGDVDAGELEFGGGVEAGEGRGAAV
ncbi:hypothetical protein ABC337_02715 [Arthrobacter sp. 1P04PC]